MITQQVSNAGFPQGLIHDGGDRLFLYATYNPQLYEPAHVYTYRGAFLRWGKTRLAWSEPVNVLPHDAVRTIGSMVWQLDQYADRFLLLPAPRQLVVGGSTVGLLDLEGAYGWAIQTPYSLPTTAYFAYGVRGGLKVRPSQRTLPHVSRSLLLKTYSERVRLHTRGWPFCEQAHSKLCQDGNLYVLNRQDNLGLVYMHMFSPGGNEGWCTLPLSREFYVTDFDVSPSGRSIAVAGFEAISRDNGGFPDRVRRHLHVIRRVSATAVELLATYTWEAKFVSYAPDGLTLAFAKVGDGYLDPVDELTIVDVDSE